MSNRSDASGERARATDAGIERASEVVELIRLARESLNALPRDSEEEGEALGPVWGHLNDAWSAVRLYALLRGRRYRQP